MFSYVYFYHHTCVCTNEQSASLRSRWVGWKYFNRPLVQQIWGEPRGASATAHNPFEKYLREIQLRNTVEKYSWEIQPATAHNRLNWQEKTLWGASYLLVEGPHTGEYSEHTGEYLEYSNHQWIFFLEYLILIQHIKEARDTDTVDCSGLLNVWQTNLLTGAVARDAYGYTSKS